MIEPIFSLKVEQQDQTHGVFVYEPLNASFGNSIGNALRRTLLSSLPGAAITYVKFTKANHLFATIPGVKESVLDIVLNLKKVRFVGVGEEPVMMKLNVKEGEVTAAALEGEAEVVNKDQYIAYVTDKKASLELEVVVENGYGYQSSNECDPMTGYIAVDASFSPVKRVNFKVEEARVGRKSNYDRLVMEVWTDGSIEPLEAVKEASLILAKHFEGFHAGTTFESETAIEKPITTNITADNKINETIIDELNLPSRVINALLREGIETVGGLLERGKEDLTNLKGVGKKSIELIEEELKKMDVELK
ncbi:DNA-directed RNA polymerase subunit alpha [Candidatus Woesebacteria bacterium]|nr:DNA-directed RNA polymerase subunit alpha [Candidatus Woesebacteria bacterium]